MTADNNKQHFAGGHQIFGECLWPVVPSSADSVLSGLLLFILALLTVLGALVRKFLPLYNYWKIAHRGVGWALLVWSYVCIFTGLGAYGTSKVFIGLVAALIGVYAVVGVVFEVSLFALSFCPTSVSHSLHPVQETQE